MQKPQAQHTATYLNDIETYNIPFGIIFADRHQDIFDLIFGFLL